jgi:hypothetical protein
MAVVETLRALKHCYPDRWEAVWRDLQGDPQE